MNLSKRFFGSLNLYKTTTFLEKITIMDYNNGLYDLHHYVKNDLYTRMKKMCGLKLGIPEAVFHRCSLKQVFLNNLQIHMKAPVLESLFDKVEDLKACNFMKKRLQHRCFPPKFVELLRKPSFTEHLWWLLFGLQKTDTRPFS